MAKIKLLLQAVTTDFHASALKKMLSHERLDHFIGSVAFIRQDGVEAVASELKSVAKVTKFFVGIRNDITSVQALRRLLELGIKTFVVDTGSRSTIFHPKVFLARSKTKAAAIIGSANMTFSGLHNNIEAGAILALNLKNPEDKAFWDHSVGILEELPNRFPEHVFEVKNARAVQALFDDGRLVDEDVVVAPSVSSSVRKGERDKLTRMKLVRHTLPVRARKRIRPKAPAPTPVGFVQTPEFALVWESRELKERDLNIPSGGNTNPTGSMLWKKGAATDIDQRHFFRDEVFAGLNWKRDTAKKHIERAVGSFQIVVKGLKYGTFELKLSHNTDKTSKSYKQNNSMTQIHWGPALQFIAKRDLLGRIMSLYLKDCDPPEYIIEID